MFRKLLKHEFRATRGLLGTLSCAALFLSIPGGLALRLMIHLLQQDLMDTTTQSLGIIALFFAMFFIILALCAYIFGTQIYLYFRFYKHKFTDEGYLTFTLPASTAQIYLSSYCSILLWNLLSGLVCSLSISLIALIGAGEYLLDSDVLSQVSSVFEEILYFYDEFGHPILTGIASLLSVLSAPAIPMVCITLGAVLAKKHKILMAFAMYYGISTVMGFLQSVSSVFMGLILVPDSTTYFSMSVLLPTILTTLIAAGGSILSIWLTKHKLNLP